MSNYLVDGADLTSVANAIRTKGGTSEQLAFPVGFVSAVEAIETGIEPTGTKTVLITENGTREVDIAEFAKAVISANISGAVAWPEPTATFVAGSAVVPSCFNNAKFIPKYDNELIIYVFQPESGAPTSGSVTCYMLGFHRINKDYGTTNRCWAIAGPQQTKPWSGTLTWAVRNSTGVYDDADGYITFPTTTWYRTNSNSTIKVYEIPYSSMGASAT